MPSCQEQSILMIIFLQDMTVASVVTSLLFSNVHGYEAEMESRQFTVGYLGYVHILTRKCLEAKMQRRFKTFFQSVNCKWFKIQCMPPLVCFLDGITCFLLLDSVAKCKLGDHLHWNCCGSTHDGRFHVHCCQLWSGKG